MRTVIIAAQSLDGFITRHDQPGTAFTSEADKAWFAGVLEDFDCCVMGGVTYRVACDVIRGRLSEARLRVVLTRSPAAYAGDAVHGQLEFSCEEPAALLATLAARGYRRCAILGGAQVHRLFLAARLVDEVWLTLEPRLFGSGTPFLAGATEVNLAPIAQEHIGEGSLLVRYRVVRQDQA